MDDAQAYCEELVRDGDKNNFLATLFAPEAARPFLFALYAFNLELTRIPDRTREALAGEMRLQWWREVLDGARIDEANGHPVASALKRAMDGRKLPVESLLALIDAHAFGLYDKAMPSWSEFETHARRMQGALFVLAGLIVSDASQNDLEAAAGLAGVAQAVADALPNLPSRGRLLIPRVLLKHHGVSDDDLRNGRMSEAMRLALTTFADHGAVTYRAAQDKIRQLPGEARVAFLILSLAPSIFTRIRRVRDPFAQSVELPQWRRQWILFRAARSASW